MQELIRKEIKKIRNKYADSAEEIVSGYNRECEYTQGYEGRQIYELLQNADAVEEYRQSGSSDDSKDKVKISFDGKTLTVSNTGAPFSFEGINSLLYPNASPKKIHENMIGSKGLGFRAILSWADQVTVASKDFTIQFSRRYAAEFFEEIVRANPGLVDRIKKLSSVPYPIATLSCPKIIENSGLEPDFSTSIIIDCKDGLSDRINEQIKGLEFEELIFLPNLKEIDVQCNEYQKTFFKVAEDNDVIIESRDNLTGEVNCTSWHLFKKTGSVLDENGLPKKYEFIIAYDPESSRTSSVLYSFFKTDVKLTFPALVHGTFELTADRNGLQKQNYLNQQLVPIMADFLVETAVTIAESQDICNYDPLRMVISTDLDYVLAKEYQLDALLKDKAKEKPILPTISGKYVAVCDKPKYSCEGFDKIVSHKSFGDLMPITNEKEIVRYLKATLGIGFYGYHEFCEKINESISEYSLEQRAILVDLIDKQYRSVSSNEIFPHLLVDSNGISIESQVKVYPLPEEEQVIALPEWVKIRFLSADMEECLYSALRIRNSRRELAKRLSRYNLEEYNFDKLLRGVVSQTDSIVDSAEKSKDILNWLWKYYAADNSQPPIGAKVKVLCRDGELRYANDCYLGNELSNTLGERMVRVFSSNFLDVSCFDMDGKPLSLVSDFLEWVGASKYPRFISKELSREERLEYLKYCNKLYVQSDSTDYLYSEFGTMRVVVGYFEHFDELIDASDFNDLLAWFVADENISSRIASATEGKNRDSCIIGRPGRKQNDRHVVPADMKSYLHWRLSHKKWIPGKDGTMQYPNRCCFEDDNLSPLVVVPNVDYLYINKLLGQKRKHEVEAVLSNVGVADHFQEMDKRIVYDVLLNLHSIDNDYSLGRKLYRKMIRDDVPPEEYTNNNPSYTKFIKEGTVLVKNGSVRKYVPISEAYYSDKKIFSDSILHGMNMFDIDGRSGVDKVQKLFGVKSLKCVSAEIDDNPQVHVLDDAFRREFAQFLPFVYACRIGLKNARADFNSLKSARILLCSQVKIKYIFEEGAKTTPLRKFEGVYLGKKSANGNTAVIQAPSDISSFSDLIKNVEFANAVAEIIAAILDLKEGKEFYADLLRDDMQVREYKMRKYRDDENLELLTEARTLFDVEIDPRDAFWRTLAEVAQLNIVDVANTQEIIQAMNVDEEIASNIQYDNLSKSENGSLLVSLFGTLNIGVSDFNSLAIYRIDLSAYWSQEISSKRKNYRKQYEAYLYESLKDNNNNAEDFYEKCEGYDKAHVENSESLVDNIDSVFERVFGVSISTLEKYSAEETDTIVQLNISRFSQNDIISLENRCPKSRVRAYALFDRISDLLCSVTAPDNEQDTVTSADDSNGIVEEILSSEAADICTVVTDAQVPAEQPSASIASKHQNRKHTESAETARQKIGIVGEAAVFRALSKKYPSTRWVSGNAEKARSIEKGDDTCGYDMYYVDENGITKYVEVKASRDEDIVFYLSESEFKFALNHKDVYEIIYVPISDDGRPKNKIWNLGNLFMLSDGETLFDNKRFTIESNSYTITATASSILDGN